VKFAKSVAMIAALIIGVEIFLLLPFLFLSGSESGMEVLLVAIFAAFVALVGWFSIRVWRKRLARP
jgi:hypothetical protein